MKVVVSPAHRLDSLTDGAVASSSRLPIASNCAMIGEEQTVNKEQTVNNVKDRSCVLIFEVLSCQCRGRTEKNHENYK